MIPFFIKCFETLNPNIKHAHLLIMMMKLKMKATYLGLEHPSKCLFKHLSLEIYLCTACENPFIWCCNHEGQFSNVAFMAKQIIGIARTQIEINRVFKLVRVLTTL
jgi:hypothetical protein